VVGNKGKSGAFVFGIYKFACGIVIFLVGIADSYNRAQTEITEDDKSFIRMTMVLIPGGACLLSSLIVLSYPIEEYGDKNKKKLKAHEQQKTALEEELVC
jgi:Na+/melibiose symporter-like transporter